MAKHYTDTDSDTRPPPCSDCEHAPMCATWELACLAYRHYVTRSIRGRERQNERIPARYHWAALMEVNEGDF